MDGITVSLFVFVFGWCIRGEELLQALWDTALLQELDQTGLWKELRKESVEEGT